MHGLEDMQLTNKCASGGLQVVDFRISSKVHLKADSGGTLLSNHTSCGLTCMVTVSRATPTHSSAREELSTAFIHASKKHRQHQPESKRGRCLPYHLDMDQNVD